MNTGTHTKSKSRPKRYSVAANHDRLPELTVSQEQVDLAFGPPDSGHSPIFYCDSEWSRLFHQFFRQRMNHVRFSNVLLLRFAYPYEVDLDRIHAECDLLAWVLHLVGKPWMGAERVEIFADAVAHIKGFNIHL